MSDAEGSDGDDSVTLGRITRRGPWRFRLAVAWLVFIVVAVAVVVWRTELLTTLGESAAPDLTQHAEIVAWVVVAVFVFLTYWAAAYIAGTAPIAGLINLGKRMLHGVDYSDQIPTVEVEESRESGEGDAESE